MSAHRLAALRAMAEHPRSDPHEVALARAEIERMRALGVDEPAGLVIDGHLLLRVARDRRERWRRGIILPGESGYHAWASARAVGEVVGVRWVGEAIGIWSTGTLTIERLTDLEYVMSDGSRYRRGRKSPGYKVAEDGGTGRFYLVAVGLSRGASCG